MNPLRIFPVIVTALACASLTALAQSPPADPTKPATPAKSQAAAAKADPKKTDATKKVEKKDDKAAEKKPAEKQPVKKVETPAAKADAKAKPAASKAAQPRRAKETDPVIERYKAGQAPGIRDKDGNVIPTSPDAYNVDSARKK